jgi:hypothetical protein
LKNKQFASGNSGATHQRGSSLVGDFFLLLAGRITGCGYSRGSKHSGPNARNWLGLDLITPLSWVTAHLNPEAGYL